MSKQISRREMLSQAAALTVTGAALPAWFEDSAMAAQAPQARRVSPNDEIGVGIIGCGRRNSQLATGVGGQGTPPPEARIVAVADLNLRRASAWGAHHKCE